MKIVFEPSEPGAGYAFEAKIVGGSVPKEYIPGVERGLASARQDGLVAGFPVIDFKATLVDGVCHDRDSSVFAFAIAARDAFAKLREKGSPVLLEPIMQVEVTTPEDYVSDVIADLTARRGQVEGSDPRGGDARVVVASAPLANLLGYANALRSMTRGDASFHVAYDHYAPVETPDDDGPAGFPPASALRA